MATASSRCRAARLGGIELPVQHGLPFAALREKRREEDTLEMDERRSLRCAHGDRSRRLMHM